MFCISRSVEQLIKSSEKKSHLDVKVAGAKRTYVFEDMKQRENFCQLVQQLKNMHSLDSSDVKQISIFIGTWNMGSSCWIFFPCLLKSRLTLELTNSIFRRRKI